MSSPHAAGARFFWERRGRLPHTTLARFGAMHCTCPRTAARCAGARTQRPLQEPACRSFLARLTVPSASFRTNPRQHVGSVSTAVWVSEARGLLSPGGTSGGQRGWLKRRCLRACSPSSSARPLLLPLLSSLAVVTLCSSCRQQRCGFKSRHFADYCG